jgi:hypothetical protein
MPYKQVDVTGINRHESSDDRVVVTTFTAAGFNHGRLERREVIVCLDAQRALGKESERMLSFICPQRLYGLLPLDTRLAPFDRDTLAMLFGIEPLIIPRHGYEALPVDVWCMPINGGSELIDSTDPLTLKRTGIWRHPLRNKRIARLLTGLEYRDDAEVLSIVRHTEIHAALSKARSVALLVENDEHRLNMADAVRRTQRRYASSIASGTEVQAVTIPESSLIDWSLIDVVIRADGGTGRPAFAELTAPLARPCGSSQRMLYYRRQRSKPPGTP